MGLDTIYKQINNAISKEEFSKRVTDKVKEFNGLCDETMAATLVANELGYSDNENSGLVCPMMEYRYHTGGYTSYCLKEKCAWWNRGADECYIVSLSEGIWSIVGTMRGEK